MDKKPPPLSRNPGVIHDQTPQPQPPITNRTQGTGEPVDPIAVHDRFPPIGSAGTTVTQPPMTPNQNPKPTPTPTPTPPPAKARR